eukprot:COSAG04_NODE_23506_length_337_cov_0.852941_1_plen_78_part_10
MQKAIESHQEVERQRVEAERAHMVTAFQTQRYADEETARRCLEEKGWDLQSAMQSYMPPVPDSPVAERTLASSNFRVA